MEKKRVGISGWMGSGKTTVSEYLMQRFGYERVSFATPIKWIVENWFRRFTTVTKIEDLDSMRIELFHYLTGVFNEDLVKASKAYDILLENIFPNYVDIDWSVEKNDKWRQCLQEVGGGHIRSEIDNNVWVNALMRKLDSEGLYICDDLRYPNEFEVLGNNGFTLIRLEIDVDKQMERLLKSYGQFDPIRLEHPSETDLNNTKFPYYVDANQELIWVLHDLVHIIEEA